MIQFFEAFRLHDEQGVSLELTYDMASASGFQVNLAAFACDALAAGWTEKRVESVIRTVKSDLDWREFRARLAELWTLSGGLPDPECWPAMKRRLIST